MSESTEIRVNIDGREISAQPHQSIIEAFIQAGLPLSTGVGCMGQGVCGSCRVLVRNKDALEVHTALACETAVEDGMRVSFLDYFSTRDDHVYTLQEHDPWQGMAHLSSVFPEATDCRHCGGCDAACPKGLDVQKGVNAAASGQLFEAAQIFEQCVMCDLCTLGCPEHIAPNHLGLYVRRTLATSTLRPADLIYRLRQIENGELTVDISSVQGPV